MLREEAACGTRLCITCGEKIPLCNFSMKKRRYMCVRHYRETRKKAVLGTDEKRAFNSLRSRARQDRLIFGQEKIVMGVDQIKAIITPEQMANFSKYWIGPDDALEIAWRACGGIDCFARDRTDVVAQHESHLVAFGSAWFM